MELNPELVGSCGYPDAATTLGLLRRILNRIHESSNIYYDAALASLSKAQQERGLKENEKPILYGSFDAYKIVALIASNLRKESRCESV